MKLKRLKEKTKKVSYKKIVAVIFMVFLIYIGSATFPSALRNIADSLIVEGEESFNAFATAKLIDDEYREMLDFTAPNLLNKSFYIKYSDSRIIPILAN